MGLHLRSDLLGGEDDDDGDGEGVYMNSENGILSPGEVEGGNLRCEGREGGEICNCDIRFARLTCDSASLSLAAVRVLEMLSLVGTGEGERSSCSNGQWSSASEGDRNEDVEVEGEEGSSSVTHIWGMARPEVRKKRVGEAKESNADAGEEKSWVFSEWRIFECHPASG